MTKRFIGCFIGAVVVLLAGCQQYNNTPVQTTVPAPTEPVATVTSIPTQTALPPAAPTDEPTADTEHIISVTAIKDRPNEFPERETRDDGFTEADPWEIAPAFSPADGMRFVALEITALNLSTTPWQLLGSKLVLTDSAGRSYPAQLGRAFHGILPFELHHGQRSQGWVVFEIPDDAVASEVRYPVDEKRWIVSSIGDPTPLPGATPHLVTSTSASASNLTLSLLATKDPGTPFSIFTYTYIFGYRPVNIMVEVSNLSAEEVTLRPSQFVLMDENGVLHFNEPAGASEEIDGNDLQPGETRIGEVSFDLPEGVKPGQLFYVVMPYTDEYLQISVQQ